MSRWLTARHGAPKTESSTETRVVGARLAPFDYWSDQVEVDTQTTTRTTKTWTGVGVVAVGVDDEFVLTRVARSRQ